MSGLKAVSDLLLYAEMVGPGVMRLKDGALLTGFRLRGPDLESAPPSLWEATSAAINEALLGLGEGWTVHFESVRIDTTVSPSGDFDDPASILIDEERSRTGYFRTEQWLFLTRSQGLGSRSSWAGRFRDWLYEEPPSAHRARLKKELESFEAGAGRFLNSLCAHLRIKRMRALPENDELLQAVYFCLTGRWQKTRLPDRPVCLDVLLAEDWLQGNPLTIGRRLVRTITLRGYPGDTYPGALDSLQRLPFTVRWSQRFIVQDYQQSEALLKREQRRWQQKARSFASQILRTGGRLDQHAVERSDELDVALQDLNEGAVVYGHHTSVLVVSGADESEVAERSAHVERVVQSAGYIAHVETYNGIEAFVGSLPGHRHQNVRRPIIHSLNLADSLPISREWTGERECPCPMFAPGSGALATVRSASGGVFHLNLHVNDVGHTLILGPTGSGKSTLLAFLANQFRAYDDQGAQVFAFDKGRSLLGLTKAFRDGAHVDFGVELPSLCPLDDVDSPEERAWAAEWLEDLLALQDCAVGPKRRQLLVEALDVFAHGASGRRLSDFITTLQDEEVREALAYYAEGGPAGTLLDASATSLPESNFVVFEIEDLMNRGPRVVQAVLSYLFHAIERRLDGRPTLLALDEAWLALGHELFAEKIREWLKVLRKRNCAVVLATQSLTDVVKSPVRDAVLESCPTRILLPNPQAQTRAMKRLYGEHLRLDEAQIQAIAEATPKRQYFYTSPHGSRLFELGLGPVALSFLGASAPEDLRGIATLQSDFKDTWPGEWLRARGLPEYARRYEELLEQRLDFKDKEDGYVSNTAVFRKGSLSPARFEGDTSSRTTLVYGA